MISASSVMTFRIAFFAVGSLVVPPVWTLIYLDHVLLCHVIFVCVCCGEEYKDSKMAIEKYVAWKTRALFWRNGRAFKEPKANVQEPEGIENIEPSIKKVIDQMIGNFNK